MILCEQTFRWYGPSDPVSLADIKQAGATGIITALHHISNGEVWSIDEILLRKTQIEAAGLRWSGVESVPVHEHIKTRTGEYERYIGNYCTTLRNLGKCGIKMVTYNFMPVFDWTRTDLAKPRPDGSTVLAYDQAEIDKIDPANMFAAMEQKADGHLLPGWEPERVARIQELFEQYRDVDEEKLWQNLKYFLQAIMPACEKYGVKMAIHPDDPAWSVFGLPRIITGKENLLKLTKLVDSPCNGITFCTGSLGTNPAADLPDMIRSLKGRIHFAHIRNMEHTGAGKFEECAHLSEDGSFDMFEIMKALYDIGFDGIMRPDHGRMIWGEQAMPGYGLYDRALGSQYLLGLWEALSKMPHTL